MIDLRHLRQFVAVAEELHFGRAAKRLHMTQPPLTQAVQSLETELEVRLFDRNKKSVALTPAGEALLVLARRLLRDADELPRTVKAAANGFTGHLRLGFVSTVTYGSLPHLLRSFGSRIPTSRCGCARRRSTCSSQPSIPTIWMQVSWSMRRAPHPRALERYPYRLSHSFWRCRLDTPPPTGGRCCTSMISRWIRS